MNEMDAEIIIIKPSEIKNLIKEALKEHAQEAQVKELKYYSIHATAKLLGRSDRKVGNLIKSGLLKCTKEKRISSVEIENLLKSQ